MQLPPRWVVAVSLGVAAAIMGDSLLYAVLPSQWPHLGLEVGMVGTLLSANRLIRLGSNPLAGWVMGRWGLKGPFVIAVFVAAGTTAAYASGLGFFALLGARALWGICWSFLRLGGYLAALEVSLAGNRGYYLGFFSGMTRVGSFAATLAGGLLTDLLSFETTVLLFAVFALLGGLGVLRERPPKVVDVPPTAHMAGIPTTDTAATRSPVAEHSDSPLDRSEVLRLWTIYGVGFLHALAVGGLILSTLGLWLLNRYGSTTQVFSLTLGVATITGGLMSARFLGDLLGAPLSGHLSDRHGRAALALLAIAVEAGSLLGLAAANSLALTAASAVALFFASTALGVTIEATVGDHTTPTSRARTMSWYATWADLGAALGPLAGYQIGAGIGLEWMYRGSAVVMMLVGLAYIAVFRGEIGLASARRRARQKV